MGKEFVEVSQHKTDRQQMGINLQMTDGIKSNTILSYIIVKRIKARRNNSTDSVIET